MSNLFQRHYVKSPYERAREYLARLLHDAVESGEPQILRLTVPLGGKGRDAEKDVLVTYGKAEDRMHFDQPFAVHWAPKDGGPYPEFNGTLTVRADEDFTSCALELQGSYTPPLGVPGQIFDVVVGSRIASITARELLQHLGKEMERQYQEEESLKSRTVRNQGPHESSP